MQRFSFGVVFIRSKEISEVQNRREEWVKARNPNAMYVQSVRQFGTSEEAAQHGKRFKRIEGHKAFFVIYLNKRPNAWINQKTGKTNPLIGRQRTNRR